MTNLEKFQLIVAFCKGAFIGMVLIAVGIMMIQDRAKRRLLGQLYPIALFIVLTIIYYLFITGELRP